MQWYTTSMLCLFLSCSLIANTWNVGPDETYKTPSAVADIVGDGDTILIQAGEYLGDVAVWRANALYIKGHQGKAHLRADGQHAEGKAIWVINGDGCVIDNIEFSEATVPDHNGAGIRHQGGDLTVRNCYFHDNETGILSAPNPNMHIVIEQSEFFRNSYGDGFSHNLYINDAASLTVRFCYFHHAVIGHNVKSRGLRIFCKGKNSKWSWRKGSSHESIESYSSTRL